MPIALAREISPGLARCELTHLERRPIDLEAARREHAAYLEALARLGCEPVVLPADPQLPDSVFVEDTAVVLDELAVLTRPGAPSRRPETRAIREALAPHREVLAIEAPGTLDGGDVLRIGRELFVGRSSRSDRDGMLQLAELLAPRGYSVRAVEVAGCLHLKSAACQVAPGTILINADWVDRAPFRSLELIDVDPSEPFGANALLLGGMVLYPDSFPRTRERLVERGLRVEELETSELQKAEGGVTCCSLIFERAAP